MNDDKLSKACGPQEESGYYPWSDLLCTCPSSLLIETKLRESDKAFFATWFMPMMMSFWDSVINVAFHKGMRNMVASYLSCWKSNGIRNTETRSTRVNVFTSVRFLRTKILTKILSFRSCIL